MLFTILQSQILRKNTHLMRVLNINRPFFMTPTTLYNAESRIHYKDPCGGSGSKREMNPCGAGGSTDQTGGQTKHQISYQSYQPLMYTCHDEKNMRLNRPMSPHLTIYAPTLPAMTSIVQRATGVILVTYALLMAIGSLFLSNGVETYVSIIQSLDLSRPSIFIIKICLGAPFVYHYFNGIRFCMWNVGKWFDLKEVYSSARMSFIATAAVTVIFALL